MVKVENINKTNQKSIKARRQSYMVGDLQQNFPNMDVFKEKLTRKCRIKFYPRKSL